ncbi:cache domain-containing protein [Pararhizobium antarcticum]|uniref:Double Cache domain-containing protein n=1 Tax=Pararhizobium antarcticum TaxID=1798805 RepID=A0A657LNV4_9HYPH|nr:cache domain-containing protein [Pararhizobium antarcticum]OJF92562.1 hypothetical protein AX760_22425 [Pararhizobium antarcticum]OJF95829.1 hypothetical protein AX761_16970 [Rhizobium sp. 58]
MRLDTALSLISATTIATILAIGGLLTQYSERALLNEAERIQIEDASTVLSTAMAQAATLSATHSEAIASDARVAEMVADGNRQALLAYSSPLFERLNTGGGINVMHFHTAEMKSFLRVWEPENFGQDLSKFRPMVIAVNYSKRTQKGLEVGVRGLSLRAVSAIVSAAGLTGTVEIGVDLTSLLHLAKAATGADYALFLDPSASLREDGTKVDGKGGLSIEAATDAAFFARIQQANTVRLSREPQLTRYSAEGQIHGVMGSPLLDYSGNLIGTIVIARDFTRLESQHSRAMVTIWAISICGFLIAFPVFMIAIRAFVVRPLNDLVSHCTADSADPTPLLPSSQLPEYLVLRGEIEHLRKKLREAPENRGPAV